MRIRACVGTGTERASLTACVVGGLAIAMVPFLQSCRGLQVEPIHLAPCSIHGVDLQTECGTVRVFENRATKTGRTIDLKVVRIPAASTVAAADPVFLLVGGPGQSAVSTADDLRELRDTNRDRAVVLVDQRGTGDSNPLNCTFYGDKLDIRAYLGDQFDPVEVRRCREELARHADLAWYTTPAAVADLDEVRAALGYQRINLEGASYGTRVALEYLRRHPDRVRAVVLLSVVPTDFALPLPYARAAQDAMERLLDDCHANERCHAAFPRIRDEFQAVLRRLDGGPVAVTVTHPVTGAPVNTKLTRGVFVERLRLLLYSKKASASVPMLIHAAAEGDWAPFANLAAAYGFAIFNQVSMGMQLSVVCTEDVPLLLGRDLNRATAGTFAGDYRVRQQIEACAGWPRGMLPHDYAAPVRSALPVLILSGENDPAAPPRWGDAVASFLPNSRHIIIPNAGHTPSDDCISRLIAEFFASVSAGALDASCIASSQRPPFVTP
jgi:pimeloyl-ACP methyl ester carboxylesterase